MRGSASPNPRIRCARARGSQTPPPMCGSARAPDSAPDARKRESHPMRGSASPIRCARARGSPSPPQKRRAKRKPEIPAPKSEDRALQKASDVRRTRRRRSTATSSRGQRSSWRFFKRPLLSDRQGCALYRTVD